MLSKKLTIVRLLSCAYAANVVSCQSLERREAIISSQPAGQTAPPQSIDESQRLEIRGHTQQEELELPLDKGLLDIRQVTRPSADVREGPGIEFNLLGFSLKHGQHLIVLGRRDPWVKIATTQSFQVGWVHRQTISKFARFHDSYTASQENIKIKSNVFPSVFAATDVNQVYPVNKNNPVDIRISRGASFKVLREENGRKLLWSMQHNILFWGDSASFL